MKKKNLFVYGSLCEESLRERILGRVVTAKSARLYGYRAFYLTNEPYPALRQVRAATTPGWLLFGLDAVDFQRLDRYEGALYTRQRCKVQCQFSGHPAWVYVLRPQYRACLGSKRYFLAAVSD